MKMMQLARKLYKNDFKLILRDRFMIFMFLFVILITFVLRFGLPWFNTYLAESGLLPNQKFAMSLADFYPLLVAFFAIFQGALISGTIFGFAFLDEKDDKTIKAMLVTPIQLDHYILYRVITPAIFAFFVVFAQVLLINQALIPLWQLFFIAIGASLTAPIASLFYAVFAENKVQGFAMAKIAGVIGWIILFAWFVPVPSQWLFGIFPPFFISKAYWIALEGNSFWPVALIFGIIAQIGLIILLAKRFKTLAYG